VITFPDLGRRGRLGNQLFQMAATIATATEHGDLFGFPEWPYAQEFPISGCFYDRLPKGPEHRDFSPGYRPIPYAGGLRLYGYFASEKFFAKSAVLVRKLLTPKKAAQGGDYGRSASVHVRRTDYVGHPQYAQLGIGYYARAMEFMRANRDIDRFTLLSDDPEWCGKAFSGFKDIEIVEPLHDSWHLAIMASCAHHVIANSTFSWWGAWLNPSTEKLVIAPSRWFGAGSSPPQPDASDLYPEGWLLESVEEP